MGTEIERKFLVADGSWQSNVKSATRIVQGYLANTGTAVVRVRVRGDHAFVTIKGATAGIARSEFEYEIPVGDALQMLDEMAQNPVIDKVRHLIDVGGHTWELDVFAGDNEGLVMAEIELGSAEEDFVLPRWAGEEVSNDERYFNVNLATNPFRTWRRSV